MWERALKNFRRWRDSAEDIDPHNILAALKIIDVLMKYAMEFCDADEVLKKVDDIAKEP